MSKKTWIPFLVILLASLSTAQAQYFFFSQKTFSELLINPAYVATDSYASMSALHRNQQAAEDFNIQSTLISAKLPFINRAQNPWSGVGITFLDDRSGSTGTFKVQELGLQYAVRVPLSIQQSLTLGMRFGYENRSFSLDGLFTGSQYIPGRGFNMGLGSGETPEDFRQQIYSLGGGLLWQAAQRDGSRIAELGVVVTDLYQNSQGYFGGESVTQPSAIIHGSLHLSGPTALSLDPTVRMLFYPTGNAIHLGGNWNYALLEGRSVSVITEYVVGRQGILGVQFTTEKFAMGFSYDITLGNKPGNQGAIEFGVSYRWKRKNRSADRLPKQLRNLPPPSQLNRLGTEPFQLNMNTPVMPDPVKVVLNDSTKGNGYPGELGYHPFETTDSLTLHLNYDLNSVIPQEGYLDILTKIASSLKEREQAIHIVGHTDASGSDEYNKQLSQRRADFLKEQIISLGIDRKRVTSEGRGESDPIPGGTPAENRRVVFILQE